MAEDKIEFEKGVFPSPILPNNIKNSRSYGISVARSIFAATIDGTNGYYQKRNDMFKTSRAFASGKQPMARYWEIMGINPAEAFIKLEYHPRPIAPHFRDILINSIMERVERVDCTGLSLEIKQRKEDKKNDAAFRMKEKEFIGAINQETGVEFEDPNAFVPENEEELDMWLELNDKEREELLMEEGINFVLYNNDWEDIKKEVVGDLVDTALAATQNYFDGVNRIRLKRIKSEFLFYGTTEGLNISAKVPYCGHMERMSIVDVRCMWPNIPEKELYKAAKNNINSNGNPSNLGDWNSAWEDVNVNSRPYDGYLVDIMFFEYRATKYITGVKGKDNNGRKIFDLKEGKASNPNKQPFSYPIPTIYSGAWIVGTDLLPKWGEMENLLRSNEDKEDVRFSYSIYMLSNDGTMLPKSPMGYLESSIINMDIAILKIMQLMATTPPNGVQMDIDSVLDLDLGEGIGKTNPMKLREIRLQTGDRYYSSKGIDGENKNPPMQDATYSMGSSLGEYINIYNFEFNNIRTYISVNEAVDGIGVGERQGMNVMNNQIKASNTATSHIYGGLISIMGNSVKGIAIRLWDTLKSADANSMYMKLLNKANADFIKKRKDITDSNYDVMIKVGSPANEMAQLEQNIERSLGAGLIQLEDSLIIREYAKTNVKKAIKYLSFVTKQRAKQAQEAQAKQAQEAQAIQGQQAQQQMQLAQENQQKSDEMAIAKEAAKGKISRDTIYQNLVSQALLKNMETGFAIPAFVQKLIDRQTEELDEEELAKAEQEAMEEHMAEQQDMAEQEGMEGEQMVA
jgi:hypothetical protein